MFAVPARSPPVPHVSTTGSLTGTLSENSRITRARPVISSTVSPFVRSATRNAPIWPGLASPDMIERMAAPAACSSKSSPRTSADSVSAHEKSLIETKYRACFRALVWSIVRRMREGTVRANGIEFAYIEEGDGPVVLLMHGFPDVAQTWTSQMRALADAGY